MKPIISIKLRSEVTPPSAPYQCSVDKHSCVLIIVVQIRQRVHAIEQCLESIQANGYVS